MIKTQSIDFQQITRDNTFVNYLLSVYYRNIHNL